ncbi:DUF7059 domain-containing protein [Georgenia sp. Z1344]|uniref:DUF7059 domain-containing protein n=1 Tax=Georgenia sp. Z1344 TaxID=3416706 RepID=UPI003CF7B3E0
MPELPEDVLAAAWRRVGFTPDGVAHLLGPLAESLLASGNRAPALRALERAAEEGASPAGDRELAAWVRLLVLGESVRAEDLSSDGTDDPSLVVVLVALGIAESDGESVTPLVTVRPVDLGERTGWAVSDPLVPGREPASDHVIGIGSATTTLDALAVRPAAGDRVLDVGTGSGYLALRAAAAGARVVATDVNPRALALTGLGADLSGLAVDARLGSLLAPARGRFDRIVSNPPFVVSGRTGEGATYRDGGAPGDALVAELLRGVGDHIEPGGTAQLLANWEERAGEDWTARVGGWVDPALDLWVVRRDSIDPATYVDTWLRDGGTHPAAGRAAFEAAAERWLGDLEARGVTAIGMGHVTVRRPGVDEPAGAPWRRLEDAQGLGSGRLGDHVAAVLDAVARLRPALDDDDALLATTLLVAPDVTEVRHHRPGAAEPEVIELVQGGGYARTIRATTGLSAVVGACDGELPLGVLVDAVAGLLEVPATDLRAELTWWLRELLVTGMLVPTTDHPEKEHP